MKKLQKILPFLGFLIISINVLPYLLLGEKCYIQILDQMDGEILNYIYQAKYLFKGDTITEFMNGMSKSAMLPPAPFGVVFYKLLPPFLAFAFMHYFVLAVGYLGMYFLCKKMNISTLVSVLTGILFCYIPFYSVYGLAILGQPLLVFCIWKLCDSFQHTGVGKACFVKKKLPWILGIICYGGFSSLTLVGFAWIGVTIILTVWFLLRKQWKYFYGMLIAFVILLITYCLTNLDLLKTFMGNHFVTHRTEMALPQGVSFLSTMENLLVNGGTYANVYAKGLLVGLLGLGIFYFIARCKKSVNEKLNYYVKLSYGLFALLLVGAVAAALWNTSIIISIRGQLGGVFTYFQADRVYWIFPFLWTLICGCMLEGCYALAVESKKMLFQATGVVLGICLFSVQGVQILKDNMLNVNMRLLLLPNYHQLTWEGFYMEDVFASVDQVLLADKENYNVVSLGMYPSVPLYNGYRCADGYSNNYDVAYKHSFREIIADELAKDKGVEDYYDAWGNRCYFVHGDFGYYSLVSKNDGRVVRNATWNIEAMKKLNIKYIFSAAPIENPNELSLSLVAGSPFTSESAYYAIWIYQLPLDV